METELAFEEWKKTVPDRLSSDPLWKSVYYQLAMHLYDLVWDDCKDLRKDFRGREIGRQLIRSAGSISANVEEAYGRGIGTPDCVRILRIALGEAEETQGWYFRARHIIPDHVLKTCIDIYSQIISLLVNAISRHRRQINCD
ncbi:four helix bundle protein [Chloroflexota bacterium]